MVLGEEGRCIVGRKESLFSKEGFRTSLFIGRIEESGDRYGTSVFVDALMPHVIFVAGARGSGKSYTLGVFVEELAEKVPYVGVIVIDPVGVFWSMKLPNREKDEVHKLADWGITPKGYDNVCVFVPEGITDSIPELTYDKTFSLMPSMLTVDDWVLTFGLDRFSPAGLLLEKTISHLKNRGEYGIDDIIQYLEDFEEVTDKEKGFKKDTVRALLSRFYSAKSWGIFSERGTPLSELSKPGVVSVVDISFLDENVGALVIGVLARRILHARKIAVRQEAAVDLDIGSLEGESIPPTWLIIDEAHTLIPSGGKKTPATDPLVEYVKQGRRPGCSLLLATQQPSAVDVKVLSQIDMLITHKLVFLDDVKAVERRMPNILPKEYTGTFMRRIPVGTALLGDRSDSTSRVFLVRIRPRRSQHEGRELAVDTAWHKKTKEHIYTMREVDGGRKEVFEMRVMEGDARRAFEDYGRSILSRIFGRKNIVLDMNLRYIPVWIADYSVFTNAKSVEQCRAYIDSYHGEFLHYKDGKIVFSEGLKYIYKLSTYQRKLLVYLYTSKSSTLSEIIAKGRVPADLAEKEVIVLKRAGLVGEENGRYFLSVPLMLPTNPFHPLISSPEYIHRVVMDIDESSILKPKFDSSRVKEVISGIWKGTVVRRVGVIYRPVWEAYVKTARGKQKLILDAVTGTFEKEVPVVGE